MTFHECTKLLEELRLYSHLKRDSFITFTSKRWWKALSVYQKMNGESTNHEPLLEEHRHESGHHSHAQTLIPT